jgi:hypothetical protein
MRQEVRQEKASVGVAVLSFMPPLSKPVQGFTSKLA